MGDNRSRWLKDRASANLDLTQRPYNPQHYIERAICHEELEYPDLAASDAYRALLLTDEALDEEGEYHAEAVKAILGERAEDRYTSKKHTGHHTSDLREVDREDLEQHSTVEEPWYTKLINGYALRCYHILARTLLACGDLRSAYDFTERGLSAFPGENDLQILQKRILDRSARENSAQVDLQLNSRENLSQDGHARREIYEWNKHEPDRFSAENLAYINQEICKIAPKCKVAVTELPYLQNDSSRHSLKPRTVKQLGIFAALDIGPDEHVLLEPSVLTSSSGLHEAFCDACSMRLPPFHPESLVPSCLSCEDIYFCSQDCHDRAQRLYHSAICGLADFDVTAKDPSPSATTNALYTLLVARTIAMAESQDVHPLDLPQIKYLWGDYRQTGSTIEHTLPFSFSNNIDQPFHLLTRLDKDLFAPETLDRYDTWVINTLLAKFRGTANAKMNERSGLPEVAGVHWLWCLANHSCTPNVRWNWEAGGMGFVARGEEDVVRWGPGKDNDLTDGSSGIKAGQEILNHYCDVELPVKERREWAVGALGGVCVCERCNWEATHRDRAIAGKSRSY